MALFHHQLPQLTCPVTPDKPGAICPLFATAFSDEAMDMDVT